MTNAVPIAIAYSLSRRFGQNTLAAITDVRIQSLAYRRTFDWHMEEVHEMTQRQAISKGEIEIARALWEISPATVRAVFESLPEDRKMDFSTVQTYLRRLETKGYVNSKLDGRVRVYSSRTKARTVIRETVDDLVQRLFGGETMPLMRHLIEERGVDEGGLAELREMIDRLEKETE